MSRVRAALWLLLALSFLLNLAGLGWGLPARGRAWDYDEITPAQAQGAIEWRAWRAWPIKYPPLQLWALTLPMRAAALLEREGRLEPLGVDPDTARFVAIRLVSVLMGTLSVLMVYLAGKEFLPRAAAVIAAALHALTPTVVFYSKLGNLDIPYTFWFSVALVFFLRLLRRHRLRDYLGFALAAMASICTKDQAYALYPLTPLIVLVSLAYHRRTQGLSSSLPRVAFDRRIVVAVAGAVLLFLFAHGVYRGPGQLRSHVERITGPYSKNAAFFPRNLDGVALNLQLLARNLEFSAGWPMLLAAIGGTAIALARPRAPSSGFVLLMPLLALSYLGCFIVVLFYNYDRFTLPMTLLLAFPAAHGLWTLATARRLGLIGRTLTLLTLLYGTLRCSALNQRMRHDTRYAVESWVVRHLGPLERAFALGDPQMSPRIGIARWRDVLRHEGRLLDDWEADWLAFNVTEADSRKFSGLHFLRDELADERRFRYRFELSHRPGGWLLDARATTGSLLLVSPDIALLERSPDPALGGTRLPAGTYLAPATRAATRMRRQGRFEEACVLDERALARNPGDAFAALGRGEDARALGDLKAARAHFELAAAIDGRLAAPWLGLARVAAEQGQVDAALAHARVATEREPASPYTWLELASAERAAGRHGPAFEALAQAEDQARSADNPGALVDIARRYRELAAPARAIRMLRLAQSLRKESSEAPETVLLKDLLRQQGRPEEADWLETTLTGSAP